MYRETIYRDYAFSLEHVMTFKALKKEQDVIYRYFQKNYLPYFPNNKNSKILDLGCGFGNYIMAAKRCGYLHVIGVDGSQSCAEYCKKNEIAEVICEDALSFLKCHENEFDVIMFNDVIEHLIKDEAVECCMALKNSLSPGGVLLVKTDNMSNPFTAIGGRYMDLTHEVCYNEFSLRQLLHAVGFSDVTVKGTDIYVVCFPLNMVAKIAEKVISSILYLCNCLYGRTTMKIFTKDILAIAKK